MTEPKTETSTFSGGDRNSQRLLGLRVLGDGVCWSWMSLRLGRSIKLKQNICDIHSCEIKRKLYIDRSLWYFFGRRIIDISQRWKSNNEKGHY